MPKKPVLARGYGGFRGESGLRRPTRQNGPGDAIGPMSLRPVLRWLPMPHRPDLPRNPLISLAPARFVPAHPAPSRICHPVRSVTQAMQLRQCGTRAFLDGVGNRYSLDVMPTMALANNCDRAHRMAYPGRGGMSRDKTGRGQ